MALKLRSMQVDTVAEQEGETRESQLFPGVSYRLRSLKFPPYVTARDAALRKLRSKWDGNIPQKVMTSVMAELYAKHIVLDWSGVDTPWSEIKDSLADPENAMIVSDIERCAAMVGVRELEFVEEDAGN